MQGLSGPIAGKTAAIDPRGRAFGAASRYFREPEEIAEGFSKNRGSFCVTIKVKKQECEKLPEPLQFQEFVGGRYRT